MSDPQDFVQIDLFSWGAPADRFAGGGQTIEIGSSFEVLAEECKDIEYQQHPLAKEITEDLQTKLHFSRDERKLMDFGYSLVRYTREEKRIEITDAAQIHLGWITLDPFTTYAAAERKLKELKGFGLIEVNARGLVIMTGWNLPGGLLKSGFEFYRAYGLKDYDQHGGFCIKVGSKNWSNLAKYPDRESLQATWDELMKDSKALEG